MKIDPQCQQQYCSPLNVLFSNVQITLICLGIPPLGGLQSEYKEQKMAIFKAVCAKICCKGKKNVNGYY